MDRKENQDALDSILDTITMDDTMERKIHEFSENKKRSRRIQKARDESAKFQQTYASGKDNQEAAQDLVLGKDDYSQAAVLQTEGTQAFDARNLQNPQRYSQSVQNPAANGAVPDQTIVPGSLQASQLQNAGYPNPQQNAGLGQTQVFSAGAGNTQTYHSSQTGAINGTAPSARYQEALDSTRISQPVYPGTTMQNAAGSAGSGVEATRVQPSSYTGVEATRIQPSSYGSQQAFVPNPSSGSGTVIMDENEIQNYMEEDNPVLKREYVEEPYHNRRTKRKFNWKIPMTVGAVVLIGVLGVGAFQFMSGWMDSLAILRQEDTKAEGYFEQLMDWAKDYNSLTDTEKKKILSLAKLYNRLNESQRTEIDKVLSSITGKTFDELLAAASAGDKENSNNNNTEIAEKKAELRGKIAELQAQLNSLTSTNSASQADIDAAFAVLTDRKSAEEKAKRELDAANQKLDSANNALAPYTQTAADLQNQLAAAQAELDSLLSESSTPEVDENGNEITPPENPSVQNARQKVDRINAQIAQLNSDKQAAQTAADEAAAAQSNAQAIYNNAAASLTEAQASYEALKNSVPNNQGEIDRLTSEIQDLQNELNSL